MNLTTKADVKGPVFGIFLMTIFTLVWGLIAENALNNRDHRVLGIMFSAVVLAFIVFYIRSLMFLKTLPEQTEQVNIAEQRKKSRQFIIINSIQGISIFVVNIVLVNLHLQKYFIPGFALIVGLHFFPLASLFKNKFHIYMGCWTTFIAVLGLVFIYNQILPIDLITAFVGIGCAISTIIIGTRLILFIDSKRKINQE